MGAASMGHQSRLYVEPGVSPHVWDTSSETYEIKSESVRATKTLTDTNGVRGTRSHHAARVRTTQKAVRGTILFNPSPADLALWLPRVMGAAGPALAESLPSFGLLFDRVAETFEVSDAVCSRMTLRGAAGGLVECELEIVGKDETPGVAAPVVALGVTAADDPYVHADLTLTLDGTAREVFSFELTIDNAVKERFVNSLTATNLGPADRIITLKVECPFTADEVDLYDAAEAGIACVLTLTNGAVSTALAMPAVQVPAETPVITGPADELKLTLNGIARRTAASAELTVVNDASA